MHFSRKNYGLSKIKPLNVIKHIAHPFSGTRRGVFMRCSPFLKKKYHFRPYTANLNDIPVFIISYNRLSFVKQSVDWMITYGLKNIHIIDNNSTYPPLLEYFKTCPCTVHRMNKNWGHEVLWLCGKFDKILKKTPYIVSDPDIEPNKNLPKDFLFQMYNILGQYRNVTKVGFALDISSDDISESVKNWEKQFWVDRIPNDDLEIYFADIDTTFALYRPGKLKLKNQQFYTGIRFAGNFMAKHLPWYIKSVTETEEDKYYIAHANKKVSTWVRNYTNS